MALDRLVFMMIFFLSVSALGKLNPLIAKQSIGRIRYLSENGRISIYQKRNGELSLSTNFSVDTILAGSEFTNYLVTASNTKKYLLLEKDENYLRSHAVMRKSEIYKVLYGGLNATKIGDGVNSQLHLGDTWASFFVPDLKKIVLKSLVNSLLDFEIQLKNPINRYFVPRVIFLDNNSVLHTDMNEKGEIGLFQTSRDSKKTKLLSKSEATGQYFELCTMNKKLYIGSFYYPGIDGGSRILEFQLNKSLDFGKARIIYESSERDIGQFICQEDLKSIFFIKSYPQAPNFYNQKTDVVKLNAESLKLSRLSEIGDITNIINMDGRILVPYRSEFLLAWGDPLKDDSLK